MVNPFFSGAFFHLGPCFITKDVPTSYGASSPLAPDTWVSTQQALAPKPETAPIRLPVLTGKKELWNWLQPYLVNNNGTLGTEYHGLQVGVDGMLNSLLFSHLCPIYLFLSISILLENHY